MPYLDSEVMHARMLQTVYKKITGAKLNCARISRSWEVIGFQGSDPTTDLRDMGMLSVVCMLYFVENYRPVRVRVHGVAWWAPVVHAGVC